VTGTSSRAVEALEVPASLWHASWRRLRGPAFLVPAALAVALTGATAGVLDEGYGLRVLRGAGVLLACAWAMTTEDPAGEVATATPYGRRRRTLVRIGVGAAVLAPVVLLVAAFVQWRAPDVPVVAVGVESLVLGLVGLALGTGLRAWRDLHHPAHAAALGVVACAFLSGAAPRWYALHQEQTFGPPWEAAQIRWLALLLVVAGLLALAVRDPLADRTPGRAMVRTARRG
jgi:hypothetical protein